MNTRTELLETLTLLIETIKNYQYYSEQNKVSIERMDKMGLRSTYAKHAYVINGKVIDRLELRYKKHLAKLINL